MKKWYPYIIIVLAAFLVYFKTLFFGFTYLDDDLLILNNYDFLKNTSNIIHAFRESVYAGGFLPYYRPVFMASLILDANVFGLSPFVYHLTNVSIHIAVSILLFLLLVKLGHKQVVSLFVSLAFTLHPMLTQAVAWIPGRNDSLLALFVTISFIAFLNYIERNNLPSFIVHLITLGLAILTKESGVVLAPLCLIYLGLVKKKRIPSRDFRNLTAGYIVVAIIWFMLSRNAMQKFYTYDILAMIKSVLFYLPAMLQYLGKAIWPFFLSAFATMHDTHYLYSFAGLVFIALSVILSKRRRSDVVLFAACWIALFLLPSLVTAFVNTLEHRFYVPMIGLAIIAAEMDYVKMVETSKGARAIGVLILAVFFIATSVHSGQFRNRQSFCNNAVQTSPNSSFAHLLTGMMHYANGDMADAEREIKASLKLDNRVSGGHYYMGLVDIKMGLNDEAEQEFKTELASYPDHVESCLMLGGLYYNQGNLNGAVLMWEKALGINPDNLIALKNLAVYYYERKQFEKSKYYVLQLLKNGQGAPDNVLKDLGLKP